MTAIILNYDPYCKSTRLITVIIRIEKHSFKLMQVIVNWIKCGIIFNSNFILMQISIGGLLSKQIEIAERKGIGHPDTVCDEISEAISVALSKHYLNEFGYVMHHNVDKALLIGGQSTPAYQGGQITEPMQFIIAGRATDLVGSIKIPVEDIAIETTADWFKKHIRHLDVSKHVEIQSKIRPGSADLVQLFNRIEKGEPPLANDTSFGAGYYPLSALDQKIIEIDALLSSTETRDQYPFVGEDTKVMGYRYRKHFEFTLAIAMVDQYIKDIGDYQDKIKLIKTYIGEHLQLSDSKIIINSADDYDRGSVYLTVTGTSAENGDDGQVGRGNRVNGLITPYQPMSLEAISGKNPISHVGKIYNYFAHDLCKKLIDAQYATAAQLFIVSQIGKPITHPQGIHVRLQGQSASYQVIQDFVRSRLPDLATYWTKIIAQQRDPVDHLMD